MLVRKIIHIDMDAFFAAVEQRDNPRLKGKPVIVGGLPGTRSVVSTASYEARKFGVHSAMPINLAKKLCPHGIFLPVRMYAYSHESKRLRRIFREYTSLVEPLSVDEAYLDVTRNKKNIPSATWAARKIQQHIYTETGLTASAGVSYNLFLAKVASGFRKPGGLTVITPQDASAFIDKLPIENFYGIGKVTAAKFRAMGVNTGSDLKQLPLDKLIRAFGKSGLYYYHIVRGQDDRIVSPETTRKSLGREITLQRDTSDIDEICQVINTLSDAVAMLLKKKQLAGRTVTLKLKYDDFTAISRQYSQPLEIASSATIKHLAINLLSKTEAGKRKVRLIGVTVSGFPETKESGQGPVQLTLPF